MPTPDKRSYFKWAIAAPINGKLVMLGWDCFDISFPSNIVPTWSTRADARRARKHLTSYTTIARPVKVRVTIETGWSEP
jgi:hypothetical protein